MNVFKLLFVFVLSLAMQTNAAEFPGCSKKTGSITVALLELYTSEGCSSCPPADKLLNSISEITQINSDQLIPLAMHVDYWDYIGWKDRFANGLFTDRQEWLASLGHKREIYTPEFFLSGQEIRLGRMDLVSAVLAINAKPARADIQLRVFLTQTNYIDVEISGNTKIAGKLFYGLVENNLSSQVKAGENKNSQLPHNHVMRVWGSPESVTQGSYQFKQAINIPSDSIRENLSLVAFIQTSGGEVLQAILLAPCLQKNLQKI